MRRDDPRRRSARRLLDIVAKKFEIAQLRLRANAVDHEVLRADMAQAKSAFDRAVELATAEAAISTLPNWRRRARVLGDEFRREAARLETQKEECLDEIERALRQREAVSSYLRRQR